MTTASIVVEVINGRSNEFAINFATDAGPVPLDTVGITKVILDYDGTDIDTSDPDVDTGANGQIDWETEGSLGNMIFRLGLLTNLITPGNYTCSVIIFTATDTDGQEWRDIFQINVKATKVG